MVVCPKDAGELMKKWARAAFAVSLMPAVWVSSMAWATALTAGLLAHEAATRLIRLSGGQKG